MCAANLKSNPEWKWINYLTSHERIKSVHANTNLSWQEIEYTNTSSIIVRWLCVASIFSKNELIYRFCNSKYSFDRRLLVLTHDTVAPVILSYNNTTT